MEWAPFDWAGRRVPRAAEHLMGPRAVAVAVVVLAAPFLALWALWVAVGAPGAPWRPRGPR